MTYRARRKYRRQSRKRGKVMLTLGVVGAIIAIAALSAGLWVLGVAAQAGSIDELKPIDRGASTEVLAADGSRLGFIQSDETRTPISLKNIPRVMQNATIAIEDERFYEHGGVDLIGIFRAAWEDLKAGEAKEGASTITQQLVRNLYLENPEDNIERKIKEAALAEDLENERSKEWILEQYLNTAAYGTVNGSTAVGVEAAAQTFFDKSARNLTLREAALLAGLPQAPSQYNPLLDPEEALRRRNEVIDSMERLGYVSAEAAQGARSAGLGVEQGDRYTKVREPFFFDYVEAELIDRYGANRVRNGGLVVHTTIDPKLQELANQAIVNRSYTDPSAALVATDVDNGHILAMASSANRDDSEFNLASQGQRQPGSSFKTFVLTTAVKQGIDPDSTYYSGASPALLDIGGTEPWEVNNSGEASAGTLSLRAATVSSTNVVYAKLGLDVGNENVTETAHDMGITSELHSYPAEAIGGLTYGVSPLEMSNAYSTLANGGTHHPAQAIDRVVFPDGEVDKLEQEKGERAFSDGVAGEVTDVLRGVVSGGTATAANFGCPYVAGKTGTTEENSDAWFVGYSADISTAVWVGFPDARVSLSPYAGGFGGTLAAPIWRAFMEPAQNGRCEPFPEITDPVDFTPFFGKHSTSEYDATETTTTTEEAPEDTGSPDYDGGAYAPGVQGPPETDVPEPPIQPGGGVGN